MKNLTFKQKIVYAVSILIGGVCGFLFMYYVESRKYSFFQVLYLFLQLFLSYLLSIILHEAGHLVTGLLSGYEFVSFRVGSLTLIKEDGKIKRKKFNIAGTGGQCLLMPPATDFPENVPVTLYFLGGGLFNLFTALIFIPSGFIPSSFYVSIPLFLLGAVSLFQGLVNLIPMKLTVPNDGYSLFFSCRKKEERILFYKQLRIYGLMHEGRTPSELPEELFDFSALRPGPGTLLSSSLFLDKKDFVSAHTLIESAIKSGNLQTIYASEAKSELLFCKIMNEASKDEIDSLYDNALQSYISVSAKYQIAKRRILFAYYSLYKKDSEAAGKEYAAAMKLKESSPNAGELKSELSLIQYVNEKARSLIESQ